MLLRAFWDAFTAQDDVSLFVRTSMDGRATEELKVRLVQAALPCTRANAAVSRRKTAASQPAVCGAPPECSAAAACRDFASDI